MEAHIRYGSEFNIYKSIGLSGPEVLRMLKNSSRNILGFSDGVIHLPNESGFVPLLTKLGFLHYQYGVDSISSSQDELTLPTIRTIDIVEAPPTNYDLIKRLGDSLIELAVNSDRFDGEGVLFIDHTTIAEGVIISSHK